MTQSRSPVPGNSAANSTAYPISGGGKVISFSPVDPKGPKGAVFSGCRRYRYALWRRWGDGACAVFIGLNPSTADEYRDDPTIRRCVRFAKDWGHSGLVMLNLFAWRATNPRDLLNVRDPIGEDNDRALAECHDVGGITVAAWGAHPTAAERARGVLTWLAPIGKPIYCLGFTKEGHPRHPLYVRAETPPMVYSDRLS